MNRLGLITGVSVALALVLSAACGGSVVVDRGSGGTGGAGAGSSTSSNNSSATGVTTTTTATVGSSGSGGTAQCGETFDTVQLGLFTADGQSWGCAAGMETLVGEKTIQGVVVSGDSEGFEIDSCPPNADCPPLLNKGFISAPNLYVYLPQGAFVEIKIQVDYPWSCINRIQITNLESWGGVKNPAWPGKLLWVSASDGYEDAFFDSPFTVTKVPLGCYPDEPIQCDVHEDYVLHFDAPAAPGNPGITVPMGTTYPGWFVEGASQSEVWTVGNLRSFSSGYCDDYWNWAYFVTQSLLD